jgi:integrase
MGTFWCTLSGLSANPADGLARGITVAFTTRGTELHHKADTSMVLRKLCRHAHGLTGEPHRRAWRRCRCAWVAGISVDGRRRYVNVGADLAAARVRAAQLVADREAGRLHAGPASAAFRMVAERWLERAIREGARPQTLRTYAKRNRRLVGFIGDLPVNRIDGALMERFANKAKEMLAPANAQEHYRQLRAILRLAVDEGLMGGIPSPRVRFPVTVRPRLTAQEIERLIAALAQPYRDLGEFILLSGLRIGEALGLEAHDLVGRRLHVRRTVNGDTGEPGPPKTLTSERVVVLSDRALELLAGRTDGGRMWRVTYRGCRGAIVKAQLAAGLRRKGLGWHELRHAAASLREQAGESIRVTAAQLGHGANIPRTLRYGAPGEVDPSVIDLARHRQTSGATAMTSGSGRASAPPM